MKTRILSSAALITSLLLPNLASATEINWLAGVNINHDRVSLDDGGADTDTGYSVEAGVELYDWLQVTAGFRKFGEPNQFTNFELDSYFLRARAIHRFDEIFFYGDLGVQDWDAQSGNTKRDDLDLFFGGGVGYQVNDNISVNFGYERNSLDTLDANSWTFGVRYHF